MNRFRRIGNSFSWTARVIGGLTVLMFLVFLVGEGVPVLLHLPVNEIVMFIGLAAAIAGLLISWRWTPAGCLLILAGYAVFFIANKKLDLASPFSIFPIVVALYAIAWVFNRFSKPRVSGGESRTAGSPER